MQKKRNYSIDVMRFLFALVIICYHGTIFANEGERALFPMGALAVEFFFLVSGYMLAAHAYKMREDRTRSVGEDTYLFIKNKIAAFFPYHLFAMAACIAAKSFAESVPSGQVFQLIGSALPELFWLELVGVPDAKINGVVWYVAAMLIVMMVLYPLLRKWYTRTVYIIAPLSAVFGLGILCRQFKNLITVRSYYYLFSAGILRALVFLSLGCFLFELCRRNRECRPSVFGRVLLTFFELSAYALAIFLMTYSVSKLEQLLCWIALTVAVGITMSQKSYLLTGLKSPFWGKLASYCLPLYLCQLAARYVVMGWEAELPSYWLRMGVYVALAFALAFVCRWTMDTLVAVLRWMRKKTVLSVEESDV